MENLENQRTEAERWLNVAIKLLSSRDLEGAKRFAVRAQEKDPLWDGVDQIMFIVDVLRAAEKRINNHMDWYAVLQLEPFTADLEHIKRQYKRFAFALHPDRNRNELAGNAFKLVSDAWNVFSDPAKKSLYDNELMLLSKYRPIVLDNGIEGNRDAPSKPQVRRAGRKRKVDHGGAQWQNSNNNANSENTQSRLLSFWTACPYCYHLYEYPRVYEDCVLRCQNCRRGFHGAKIPLPPPVMPGTNGCKGPGSDGYYCCWAFFPIGYGMADDGKDSGAPNWNPFATMFSTNPQQPQGGGQKGEGQGGDGMGVHVDSDSEKDEGGARDSSDESWKIGAEERKKSTPKKSPGKKAAAAAAGNGSVDLGANVDGGVGMDNAAKRVGMRRKTMARRPKRQAGQSDMDFTSEFKDDDDDEDAADVGEGVRTESIEKETSEGIGFFAGLDDILGSLPILNVPAEQEGVEKFEAED